MGSKDVDKRILAPTRRTERFFLYELWLF